MNEFSEILGEFNDESVQAVASRQRALCGGRRTSSLCSAEASEMVEVLISLLVEELSSPLQGICRTLKMPRGSGREVQVEKRSRAAAIAKVAKPKSQF